MLGSLGKGGRTLLPEEKMGNKRVISLHLWKAESCSVGTCTQEKVHVKILDNSTIPIVGHSSVQLPLVIRFMMSDISCLLA